MAKTSRWETGWGFVFRALSLSRSLEEKVRGSARGLSYKGPGSQAKESCKVRMETWALQVRMAPLPWEAVSSLRLPSYLKPEPAQGSAEAEPTGGKSGPLLEHRDGEADARQFLTQCPEGCPRQGYFRWPAVLQEINTESS